LTRHIVLGTPAVEPAAAPSEPPAAALPTIDPLLWAAIVPPEKWAQFVQLVRTTRHLQRSYRRTVDPMLRREMEAAEDRLDSWVGMLAADLAQAEARARAARDAGKGGAL
jgi:hypothetical protein